MQQMQNAFATALLDPGLPRRRPRLPHVWGASEAFRRLPQQCHGEPHRRARGPLSSRLRIVGEEFFRASASVFIRANPPRSPLMMTYGDGFPGFLASFEPAAEIAYLADVARVEAARTRAYHAADAPPLTASDLAGIEARDLAALRFELHPSLEIIVSAFPVVTIWAMNAGETPLAAIKDWRGEDALVIRPAFEVEVRRLPAGAGLPAKP